MVLRRCSWVVLVAAGLLASSAAVARQNIVSNGSLELGPGQGGLNPFIAADWTEFTQPNQNVERSGELILTGGRGYALKAFADSTNSAAGAQQEVAAQPGNTVTATAWLYTRLSDKLRDSGRAGLRLGFYDAWGEIGAIEDLPVDADSDEDTWILVTVSMTAPAYTVKVRVNCLLRYTILDVHGSVYWDDVQLSGASGGNVSNGDFETAGVSTEPNPYGIDNWFGFEDQQKSEDPAYAYHGLSSVKLGVKKPYSGLVQEMGVLTDGDHILLKARGMIPSSNPITGTARAGIKLEFTSGVPAPPPEQNLAFDENSDTNSWQLVTLSKTVPADVTIARVDMIYVGNDATTGWVYFDAAEATTNGGPNLLYNPSFELGEDGPNLILGWPEFYTDGVSECRWKDPSFAYDDPHATARATGEAVAGIYQEIPVTEGETLDISAWLYTPGGTYKLTGTGKAGVKVEWIQGNIPEWVDLCAPDQNNCLLPTAPKNVWHEMTIDYTMPTGSAAIAKFTNIIERGDATSGVVYMDVCEAVVVNRFVPGADNDNDDDADLRDFADFQYCYGPAPLGWPCLVFDSDNDNDVDLTDYADFGSGLTGP